MRKSKGLLFAFTLAIVVNCLAAFTVIAQDKKQEESTPKVVSSAIGYSGGFMFGSAFGAAGVVKDVPFSAEMVSESIQLLYDGNRIVNRSTTVMYRDGQGRTRNEFSFKPLMLGGDNLEHKSISISDPVSGVTYMLDPQNKIAHKYTIPKPTDLTTNSLTAVATTPYASVTTLSQTHNAVPSIRFAKGSKLKAVISSLGGQLGLNVVYDDSIKESQLIDEVELDNVTLAKALEIILKNNKCSSERVDDRTIRIKAENSAGSQGAVRFESLDAKVRLSKKTSPFFALPDKIEPLGKQMVEGVEAEGTRSTQIIAAGAMGNERVMEVTTERWFSQELQMYVLTKSNDPRSGESTQRLTNLSRSEPDASLFQPPADYTIREVETSGFLMRGLSEKKPHDSNDK